MDSKWMNYAILEVRLGDYLRLWQIMVGKDVSVCLLRAKNKSLCGMEQGPLKIIIFCLLPFSFKNFPVDNLNSVVLAWEATVQKCPIQWFYFGEKYDFVLGILLI